MDILIDYLTFTTCIHDAISIKEFLGLGENVNWLVGKGRNGWLYCDYACGVRIFYGAREDVGVEMSGTGCRFLESCNENNFDWIGLFDYLKSEGKSMNVSRLDIACDEKDEILSMKKMVWHSEHNYYISRARKRRWIAGDEESIIFGAPSSDTRLRIYNKAMERGVDGHWIRAEFQLRDEAADSMIANILRYRDIGHTYAGVLNNYLRFTTSDPAACGEHYDRVLTTAWWLKFVGTADRIKNIRVGGLEYNLMDVERFLRTQCASSMKTLVEAADGDLTGLLEMIASAKLNKRQKDLLSML